jgi:hypothetical protein
MGEHRKYQRQRDRNRDHLLDGLTEHQEYFHRKVRHQRLIKSDDQAYSCALKEV